MARKIVNAFVRFVKFGRPPAVCPYCNGPIAFSGGRWWGENCDDHEGSY